MAARFPTSRWSRVIRAGDPDDPGARQRSRICAAITGSLSTPLSDAMAFRQTRPRTSSKDYSPTCSNGATWRRIDQSKGRFRSFLRAACEHYLANRRDHDRAVKRGGGLTIVSINRLDAESRYDREPAHELTAERLFERQWALTVLGRVLERLEAESVQAGKGRVCSRALRRRCRATPWTPSYATIGAELGMSDGAVRVAAHRLRARYRELLREEVGRTTDDPAAIDSEIGDLMAALASD